jgi:hypothetical protein
MIPTINSDEPAFWGEVAHGLGWRHASGPDRLAAMAHRESLRE